VQLSADLADVVVLLQLQQLTAQTQVSASLAAAILYCDPAKLIWQVQDPE
jgi:hypothetical protein